MKVTSNTEENIKGGAVCAYEDSETLGKGTILIF